jgi:hypothetical protein
MDITNIIFICALIGGLIYFIEILINIIKNIVISIFFGVKLIWIKLPIVNLITQSWRLSYMFDVEDYAHPKHVFKYFIYKFKKTKFYKLIKKWITQLKSLNQKKI